jgi:hypothetical protein
MATLLPASVMASGAIFLAFELFLVVLIEVNLSAVACCLTIALRLEEL